MGRYYKNIKLSDHLFTMFVYVTVIIAVLVCLLPFIYVISMSISLKDEVELGHVWLLPVGFSLDAYKIVLNTDRVWLCYFNTIFYALLGTVITLFFTVTASYPLIRKDFSLRKVFMKILIIPMFISGGFIPLFILLMKLGLYNTVWSVVVPGAVGTWSCVMVKTFMQYNVPESIIESARIDGANDIWILFKMVVPLITPILAVIALFTMVGHWNSYLNIIIYLRSPTKYTIQVLLMEVLIKNSNLFNETNGRMNAVKTINETIPSIQLKYAFVMFVALPIICVYPFLQKYFVKGVLIGSLKD